MVARKQREGRVGGEKKKDGKKERDRDRERERENACTLWLSPFPPFILAEHPAYRMVLPMCKIDFPFLVNPLWECPDGITRGMLY
jgi:hypothetical protein